MHYASSMALLLRTMGYPTRFAEGYWSQRRLRLPGRKRLYAIKDSNAHAWVEIYRDAFGWTALRSIPPFFAGDGSSESRPSPEPIPRTA